MTPTEQDKEPINASDELRVELVATPAEMCEHGVNLRLCNCHRCDGTAIYTEADRKRVALEARIDELDNLPWKRADKYGVNSPYVTKKWLIERKTELKAQQEEV